MMINKSLSIFTWASVSLVVVFSGCQTTGPNTLNGGMFGGATGSLIGAAVGASDGKPIEGAVVGAAVGSSLGAVAGNQIDQQIEHDRQLQLANRQQSIQQAVTFDQVVKMSASGLDDTVMINQINSLGVASRPTADQLIWLRNSQVSNDVIAALQRAPLAASQFRPRAVAAEPPYVYREQVIVEPGCYVVRPPRYPRYRRGPHRRGAAVSFSF